ncbi:polymerase [Pseudomonas phage PA7]|uniref:Uncharacterized protein n=4 Tax=root TaxID=1 RepID=I7CNS6_9CAUD|nr:polymerase [Pseudomonas phage PA7]YP_009619761.1 polymerase [Pseudomonas phage SL2]UXD83134.1 polymerase [Pseudomonas phage Koomba boorn-mokiny kep-wari Wadjak 1]WNV47822.1 putative non-virion DNA-dependent RNA polymerase subunit [Pseudomonas phage fMGyn-Pae01]BDR25097.1 hypothetical protein RVBP14_2630 [Pseudomonas phage sp. Brmt]BDR26918.1 hypothetical protein RVBP20_1590 [Pseudomonas phage sp. NK1]AFO71057.1 hypothetical protein [Pseudomonas phage PA7]
MPDPFLIEKIRENTPCMNPTLANGITVEHTMTRDPNTGVNMTRRYIDSLFDISSVLFPDGFKYEGNRACTPLKHFEEITREYNAKRIANIAPTDMYMIDLMFSYKGEMLYPRPMLLPAFKRGNMVTINGAKYIGSPVLTDVGFSVLNDSIFIPFRRTKLTFKQTDHHYMCNGQRKIMYVIWSQIHNEMAKRTKRDLDNRPHIESCLAHYFFCQFGVTQTFKQWANVDVKCGLLSDFPEEEYPREKWNIYSSATLKGKHPTGEMVLVMPRHQESIFATRLIAGFWYVVDAFPMRFTRPEYVDSTNLWRVILGHMVFGDFEHQGKVEENIDSHLHSFCNSLDEMTIEELKTVGVNVSTIWELLYEIMTSLAHHLYATDIDETSMYGKRLTVLHYLMSEFNYAVSMFGYMFQSRRDREWTVQELNEGLKRSFKLQTAIKRLTVDHGELDTMSNPNSSMLIKGTSILVTQDRAKTAKAHNKSLINDSSRIIHASIAEVGQYKNQPKNNPDGRGRLNMYTKVGPTGLVERREEVREIIDNAQLMFRAK